jgi:hypothetical protein
VARASHRMRVHGFLYVATYSDIWKICSNLAASNL